MNIPQLSKAEWPDFIANELGIEPQQGTKGPWMSTGDTPVLEWFEEVAVRLEITSPGHRKPERMKVLLSHVGVAWNARRHSSLETTSGGGDNIRKEAFEDFYRGLMGEGAVRTTTESYSRPPAWTWDEQLLAFDLYLKIGYQDASHNDVQTLSSILRNASIHPGHSRNPSFRSPSSVARKLSDIQTHHPTYDGKRTSGSKLDQRVWADFGNDPDRALVSSIAHVIQLALHEDTPVADDEDEIATVHDEGVVRFRVHRHYERDKKLRKRKLDQMIAAHGVLACEACELVPAEKYGEQFAEALDCHHIIPLSETGQRRTTLQDVALLCPTCHRIAHMARPSPSLSDLQKFARAKFRR